MLQILSTYYNTNFGVTEEFEEMLIQNWAAIPALVEKWCAIITIISSSSARFLCFVLWKNVQITFLLCSRYICHSYLFSVRGLKHLPSSNISNKKSCKSKRVRTIFTPEQLERLEAEFERQQYMVGPERLYLAHTLQLTEAQVRCFKTVLHNKITFKNKQRSPASHAAWMSVKFVFTDCFPKKRKVEFIYFH